MLSRPVTRGSEAPLRKIFAPLEKRVGRSLKILDRVKKVGPLSENSSPPLGYKAGYGPDVKGPCTRVASRAV